jgi:DNA-binding NarL/FixJ family response regulator
VSSEPISVVVLYVHPLLGEGLARLLSTESGLAVVAVEIRAKADVDLVLARDPDVVILEEGGAVRLEQLLARTRCSILVDVSLDTGEAWILRREALRTRPDDLVAAIVDACLVRAVLPRPRPARRHALGVAPVRA